MNARLDHMNRSASVADSKPAAPVISSFGKNADFARPTRAFAACIARSAAEISGRRSSNAEGKPGGTRTVTGASGASANEKSAGGLPSRIARLCSDAAR